MEVLNAMIQSTSADRWGAGGSSLQEYRLICEGLGRTVEQCIDAASFLKLVNEDGMCPSVSSFTEWRGFDFSIFLNRQNDDKLSSSPFVPCF